MFYSPPTFLGSMAFLGSMGLFAIMALLIPMWGPDAAYSFLTRSEHPTTGTQFSVIDVLQLLGFLAVINTIVGITLLPSWRAGMATYLSLCVIITWFKATGFLKQRGVHEAHIRSLIQNVIYPLTVVSIAYGITAGLASIGAILLTGGLVIYGLLTAGSMNAIFLFPSFTGAAVLIAGMSILTLYALRALLIRSLAQSE